MVSAITAAANSKFVLFNHSLTDSGRILYEPKFQKNICTRRGVLRKNSRYPSAIHLTGFTELIRITAISSPRTNARTMETAES